MLINSLNDMNMKKCALFIIGFMIIFCGCGKDYFHDTGLANGKHDCTIWEYMQQDRENWDSTILVIKRAGLQSLFDGTDGENKEITFFGPTNMSIMQFLFKTVDEEYEMMYSSIDDIPVEICRQFILSHVIREKWLSTDFEFENKGTLTGGSEETNLAGNPLRIYRTKGEYMGIPGIGAETLYVHSLTFGHIVLIASSNIEMTNGTVRSLSNSYQFTEL